MKKVTKRMFAAFAAVLMIAAIPPMSAFAAQTDECCDNCDDECTCYDGVCTCGEDCICPICNGDIDPKISEPGLEKEVNGKKIDDAAAHDEVRFTLSSNIPETLFDYLDYGSYVLTFHDKMDEELFFEMDSLSIKIGGWYIPASYYTIDTTPSDDCTFEVAVDLVQLWIDGIITDDDIESCAEIVVAYSATLEGDATAGRYYNYAHVSYPDGESVEDSVVVYTFGIKVIKVDADGGYGLEGAEFVLKDSDGNVIAEGVSAEDGCLVFDGLAAGTYYLEETRAPEGYVRADSQVEVNVELDTDLADCYYTVSFPNSSTVHTGGIGTTIFTVCGAAMITIAGAAFVISRRKKEEA